MKRRKRTSTLSSKRRDTLFIVLMLLPAILIVLWQIYYPVLRGIVMAFQNYNLYNLSKVKFIGFDNFKELLTPSPFNSFIRTIKNIVIWVFGSLIPQFLIGFAIAMLLRRAFRGRGVYQGVISFPWAVSGFIIGIMWRWMFNGTSGVINDVLQKLGLIEQPIGWLSSGSTSLLSVIIANIWYGIPYFVIMITAALQGVPQELYEAADMDGAGSLAKFRVITLPHIKSVLILTCLLRVIWIFNGPEAIIAMTNGGPAGSSQIMTSYMYTLINSLDYGKASAIGVICTVILTLYTIFYLKITSLNKED